MKNLIIMLFSLVLLTSCYAYEAFSYDTYRPRVIVIDNRTRPLHYHSPRPTDYHKKYQHYDKRTTRTTGPRYTYRGNNQRYGQNSGKGNR